MIQVFHQELTMDACGLSEYVSEPVDNQGHYLHFKRKSRVKTIRTNWYLRKDHISVDKHSVEIYDT